MLKIDMDNGKRYVFDREDYSDYSVNGDFLIVKQGAQWVGFFAVNHMVGFYIERDKCLKEF